MWGTCCRTVLAVRAVTVADAERNADAVGELASQQQEDVRLKYLEARREDKGSVSMGLAREVAEAVCDSAKLRLPSNLQGAYEKCADLGGRLGFLEKNADAARLPKVVLAALRTLQAYGNYAAHYELGKREPPPRATTSAMSSLAVVVHWFLSQDPDGERRATTELPIKQPSPGAPGVFERRRVLAAASCKPVGAFGKDGFGPLPPEAKLALLLGYHAECVHACERITRSVLARETSLDVSVMAIDQLSLQFAQLADARPERVPQSARALVDEVLRRRMAVVRALRNQVVDVEPYVLEARQRCPADDLATWFEQHYLGRGYWERNWFQTLFISLVVYGAFWSTCSAGETDKERELYHRYCTADAGAALSEFCEAAKKSLRPDGGK